MTIGERLSALVERVEHVVGVVERVELLARETNGRVTALERWRIQVETEQRTRLDERSRTVARAAARAAAREARRASRRSWLTPAGVAAASTLLGWALAHFLG